MNTVAACIITYNPDLSKLSENIYVIEQQVDKIIIVDNCSRNINQICNLKQRYENIIVLRKNENVGIAEALNIGLDYAYRSGYEWLLTLDQDTKCPFNIVEDLLDTQKMTNYSSKTVIFCPNYIDINSSQKKIISASDCIDVMTCITSGSLMNIRISKELGGFKSLLFIDHVDHEFCLRAIRKGYKVIKNNSVIIEHEIGNLTEHQFMGFNISTSNHVPVRRYYYSRNSLYIVKNYFRIFPKWCLMCILNNINQVIKISLFEKDKIIKLSYIFQGYKDGILNRYGVYGER